MGDQGDMDFKEAGRGKGSRIQVTQDRYQRRSVIIMTFNFSVYYQDS
jgi:hypothetical protein